MALGDLGFFYHSSTKVPGIVGICRVVKEAYPDFTALDKDSPYSIRSHRTARRPGGWSMSSSSRSCRGSSPWRSCALRRSSPEWCSWNVRDSRCNRSRQRSGACYETCEDESVVVVLAEAPATNLPLQKRSRPSALARYSALSAAKKTSARSISPPSGTGTATTPRLTVTYGPWTLCGGRAICAALTASRNRCATQIAPLRPVAPSTTQTPRRRTAPDHRKAAQLALQRLRHRSQTRIAERMAAQGVDLS